MLKAYWTQNKQYQHGRSRLLQMVLESVLNPYMGLCLFGPKRVVVCLTLQSC